MQRGWDSDPSPVPMPAPSPYPLDEVRPQARQTSPRPQEPRDFKAPAPQFSGKETKAEGGADAGPRQPSETASETERVCPSGGLSLALGIGAVCLPPTRQSKAEGGPWAPFFPGLSLLPVLTTARPGLEEWTLLFNPPVQTDRETEAPKRRAWREPARKPVPLSGLDLAPSLKS